MSRIIISGVGAVSPAGWSAAELCQAVNRGVPLATSLVDRPGRSAGYVVRRVPANPPGAPWLRHPRFRRVSAISKFAAAAASEALGEDAAAVAAGTLRLGIVYCVLAGCVNYSSRFYQEVLADPATASPLVFPETVFNAPASHLAALLGTTAINYTHVGDDSAFVSGLATAAGWLEAGVVDACLVIGAEEADWLTSEAMQMFCPDAVLAEGAGAVYLRDVPGPAIEAITDLQGFRGDCPRLAAVQRVRAELETVGAGDRLITSVAGGDDRLRVEAAAWRDWCGPRVTPRALLGDAFCAASAWQVILAVEALRSPATRRVFVAVAGCNQAAVGLSLIRPQEPG